MKSVRLVGDTDGLQCKVEIPSDSKLAPVSTIDLFYRGLEDTENRAGQ